MATALVFTFEMIPFVKTGHNDFCVPCQDAIKVAQIVANIKEWAKYLWYSAKSIVCMGLRNQDARTVVNAGSATALKKCIWAVRSKTYRLTLLVSR
jgi:hypothetical protein